MTPFKGRVFVDNLPHETVLHYITEYPIYIFITTEESNCTFECLQGTLETKWLFSISGKLYIYTVDADS